MEKVKVVWTGETIRVSVARVPRAENGIVWERTIIEKLAGDDVFGVKQWVVVKDAHPQLREACEKIVEISKL